MAHIGSTAEIVKACVLSLIFAAAIGFAVAFGAWWGFRAAFVASDEAFWDGAI